MGLYSTFSTSQYYDDEPVVKKKVPESSGQNETTQQPTNYKKPHQLPENGLTPQKRKSLYAEAQHIAASKSERGNVDFVDMYRIGQMLMVQDEKGRVRTRKGRVVEIVSKDLMYIGMEDTYKDVHGHWLVDFVTGKDKITKI